MRARIVNLQAMQIGAWSMSVIAAAVVVSIAGYGWTTVRAFGRYRAWLTSRRRSLVPVRRLRAPIIVFSALLVGRSLYELWDRLVAPVSYFDLFPYYIVLGALGLVLVWTVGGVAMAR